MFIADEILKYLVCEICFENYNEKDRLPLSIYACGHTFCANCINNFNTRTCPACNQAFEFTAKNWAIINLIPRAKIPEVFDKLKEMIQNSYPLIKESESIGKEKSRDNRNNLDWIRESINLRADELINLIKQNQNYLITRLNEFEIKWDSLSQDRSAFEASFYQTLKHIESELKLEDVKTNEEKLKEYKSIVEANFDTLSDRLNILNMIKNDLVNYYDKSLNLNELNSDNLFGKLVIENFELNFKSDLKNKSNQLNNDETYSDIDSALKEFDKITSVPIAQTEAELSSPAISTKFTYNIINLKKGIYETPIVYPYPIVSNSELKKQDESNEAKNDDSKSSNPLLIYQPNFDNKTKNENNLNTKNVKDEFSLIEEENIKVDEPKKRLCHLIRTTKNEMYGFDLKTIRSEGKHYVKSIQVGSPAYKAGLNDDDHIIEVNGELIEGLEREAVVSKMLKHSRHVDLVVISENLSKNSSEQIKFKKNLTLDNDRKFRTSSMIASSDENFNGSRIIVITKSPGQSGFGFSIGKSDSGPHYVSEIETNSAASITSLKVGDLILRLNGIYLVDKSYKKLIELIKKETDKAVRCELETIQPDLFPNNLKNRTGSINNLDENTFSDMSDMENEPNRVNYQLNNNKINNQIKDNNNNNNDNNSKKKFYKGIFRKNKSKPNTKF